LLKNFSIPLLPIVIRCYCHRNKPHILRFATFILQNSLLLTPLICRQRLNLN